MKREGRKRSLCKRRKRKPHKGKICRRKRAAMISGPQLSAVSAQLGVLPTGPQCSPLLPLHPTAPLSPGYCPSPADPGQPEDSFSLLLPR